MLEFSVNINFLPQKHHSEILFNYYPVCKYMRVSCHLRLQLYLAFCRGTCSQSPVVRLLHPGPKCPKTLRSWIRMSGKRCLPTFRSDSYIQHSFTDHQRQKVTSPGFHLENAPILVLTLDRDRSE